MKGSMSKGERIRALLLEGKNYGEINREVGCASSTIAYHAKQMGKQQFSFSKRSHDWETIQNYYNEGHTLKEVNDFFGLCDSTIRYAISQGRFYTVASSDNNRKRSLLKKQSELKEKGIERKRIIIPLSDILIENSTYNRASLKKRLVDEKIKIYACEGNKCPLKGIIDPVWGDIPVILHLDHINGIRHDNRIHNLRFLCPNCHSQTETYCGKNIKRVDSNQNQS